MYAAAMQQLPDATATLALPFFHLGSLDIGIPIQAFGVIVAAGVLIGASLLRRYAEWHGVSDDHIRGVTGWITVTGFLGAHWFDVIAYQWDKLMKEPVLFIKIWDGISSYGGFIGGAMGFAMYVWWKRLPVRLFADIAIIGLLPAFSIGRIGCTVVSDHVGAFVDKTQWYAALAMDYPRDFNLEAVQQMVRQHPPGGPDDKYITLWNLGLVEFVYLVPVNLLILWLAFRSTKRTPAGFITVLTGVLYAPVRFFLDYLRPNDSDPRHLGLTFAQWASILAFGVAVYAATRILKGGKPAETITKTSKEAQEKLKIILKEDEEKEVTAKAKTTKKPAGAAKARPPTDDDDEDEDADEKPKKPVVAADKKATGALKKTDDKVEVPPTEPYLDALPKDIIKKVEEGKAADAAKKAEAAKTDKAAAKADDKKTAAKTDDKAAAKADDKAADDKAAAKADDKAAKTDEKVAAKADDKVAAADEKVAATDDKAAVAAKDDKKPADKKA
jgi:phosphatidylglycerol:prolipoprotein diacylglycerol transferase